MGDVLFLVCRQRVIDRVFIECFSHAQQCAKASRDLNKEETALCPPGTYSLIASPLFYVLLLF